MTHESLAEACNRLDAAIAAGTVCRKRWTLSRDGRHLACLLATIAPATGEQKAASACPADLIPPWLAHLTPWIDDAGSEEQWPATIRRYAELLRASTVLAPEAWRRLDYRCRAVAVREARTHTTDAQILTTIDGMLALLDRAGSGEAVTEQEWRAAAYAYAYAYAAAYAAADAAEPVAADRIIAGIFAEWQAAIEAERSR
jgi:hypothetical protein